MAGENAQPGSAPATPPAATQSTAAGGEQTPPASQTALGEQPQGEGTQGGQGEPTKTGPVELKLPEGVTLPDDVMKEYQALVEKFDPQKGLEFLIKSRESVALGLQEQIQQAVENQRTSWLEAARQDKEIGGKAWDATLTSARSAVTKLGGDALRDVLNKTGLGNHPEIIRAFARAGKALGEDSIAGRAGGSGAETPSNSPDAFLKKLYPTMFPQNKE